MAQPPYVTAIVRVGTEDLMAPAQGYLALDAASFTLENEPDTVTRGADGAETIGRTVVRLVSGVALQLGSGTPEKVSNDAGEAGAAVAAAPFDHVHQIDEATVDYAGSMSAADKAKLDAIGAGAAVTGVTGTAPIVSSGGAAPAISISAANSGAAGSMSAADKAKLDAATATPTASTIVLYGASAELKGAWFAPASGTAPTTGIVRVPDGQIAITGRTSGAATAKLVGWESNALLLGEPTGVVSVFVEATTNFQVTCGMSVMFKANATQLGFFGVTPVSRPAAYTQTYSTASRTLGAYTADNESVAYTGQDNLQVGTVYAKIADLNALRAAVENLRALTENLTAVVNSAIDDLQALGLLQ